MRHARHSFLVFGFVFVMAHGTVQPALADQAVWGPVTGRTNAVAITRHQFGDIDVSVVLNSKVSTDTHRVYGSSIIQLGGSSEQAGLTVYAPATTQTSQISATCNYGSYDPTCEGLFAVNGCNYGSLPVAARRAIDFLLGPCAGRQCFTATSLSPGFELLTVYSWSCRMPHTANCVRMSGTMFPVLRIDLLEQDSGCQF